ncbi:endonuclease-reverse transcriptase [Trichonephila clavipes]|nr:endonuclease-reverse transcriptase [Trichonephila clavipes]
MIFLRPKPERDEVPSKLRHCARAQLVHVLKRPWRVKPTFKNPMGSRTRGRPPTRWIEDVENDLKALNIKNWQRVAAYRWNWRKRAVEVAKTCNRLLRL